MMQAEMEADQEKRSSNGYSLVFVIIFGLIALYIGCETYQNIEHDRRQQGNHTTIFREWIINLNAPSVPPTTSMQLSNMEMIEATLHKVNRDLKAKVDVNGDGLINCIDAAVLFYQHFPDKNRVSIILNYNEATGMNHLFNLVYVNKTWRALEPQAYYMNYSIMWMEQIWGKQYDSFKNSSATSQYLKFVK